MFLPLCLKMILSQLSARSLSPPLSLPPTTLLFLLLLNYKGIYTYLWLRNAMMNTLALAWIFPWSSFLLVHSEGLRFDIISCRLLHSKFLMLVIAPYFSFENCHSSIFSPCCLGVASHALSPEVGTFQAEECALGHSGWFRNRNVA